jgi:hypothetical protein
LGVEFPAVFPDLGLRQPLALAGAAIILVVMVQAHISEIPQGVVGWVTVEVRYLTSLDSVVSVQPKADAATSSAGHHDFGLRGLWD